MSEPAPLTLTEGAAPEVHLGAGHVAIAMGMVTCTAGQRGDPGRWLFVGEGGAWETRAHMREVWGEIAFTLSHAPPRSHRTLTHARSVLSACYGSGRL
jgi:hypothetical protein